MSVDEMSVYKMSVDEASANRTNYTALIGFSSIRPSTYNVNKTKTAWIRMFFRGFFPTSNTV